MKSIIALYISNFKNLFRVLKRISLILLPFLWPGMTLAQSGNSTSNLETLLIVVIIVLMLVSILVLVVAIYTLFVLRTMLLGEKERKAKEEGVEIEAPVSFWEGFLKSMTKSTPVADEETVMLDHDYDGIRELDNHLPPWWKAMFYLTIVWAAIYLLVFHVFHVLPLSGEEYNRDIAHAEEILEARKALLSESIDETTVEFTDDPVVLSNGKAIFDQQCAVCHAADGGGGVGPNMTDDYYIHGGSINDIFTTIKYGVPDKGMIPWQSQLPPATMRDVACYMMTLRGTTPVNPKEPQGELYNEETTPTETNESTEGPETSSENSPITMVE